MEKLTVPMAHIEGEINLPAQKVYPIVHYCWQP